MTVLAFDTSTTGCSVALVEKGRLLAHRSEELGRGQTEALLPMIDQVMAEAELGFDALDLVATTIGPGAFTGLRIGLAAAQGIALAAGCQSTGISTFDALVARYLDQQKPISPSGTIIVCVESKRADIFVQSFKTAGDAKTDPESLTPEALIPLLPDGPVVLIGDAAHRIRDALEARTSGQRAGLIFYDDYRLVDAINLAKLAERRHQAGLDPVSLVPLYMRPPDAKLPRNGGSLRPIAAD